MIIFRETVQYKEKTKLVYLLDSLNNEFKGQAKFRLGGHSIDFDHNMYVEIITREPIHEIVAATATIYIKGFENGYMYGVTTGRALERGIKSGTQNKGTGT